jgi:hypothetical protein
MPDSTVKTVGYAVNSTLAPMAKMENDKES